jgi:hypothetical protein
MTAEAQRIAIAEACGWQGPHHPENIAGMDGWWSQHRGIWWVMPDKNRVLISGVPSYLNDLNAIHHAVKSLPQNLMPRYFACLCNVVSGSLSLYGYSKATEATAAQRCEAFLKTIDKWTNDR